LRREAAGHDGIADADVSFRQDLGSESAPMHQAGDDPFLRQAFQVGARLAQLDSEEPHRPTSNSCPTRWFNGAPRVVTFRRVAPAGIVIWLSLAMASMASDSMSVTSRPGPGRSEYVPLSRKYRSPSSPFPGTARTWSTERTRASALSAM